jgi:hypothetical protein
MIGQNPMMNPMMAWNPMMAQNPMMGMGAPPQQMPGHFPMGQPNPPAPVPQQQPGTMADKKNPVAMLAEVMQRMEVSKQPQQPGMQQQF